MIIGDHINPSGKGGKRGGLRLRCKATLTFLNSFWLTHLVLSVGTDCMDMPDEGKGSCKLLYKQTSGGGMGG